MGEVLAASTDFGLDEERVLGIMNASDDPVSSAIDLIVKETSADATVRGTVEALLRFQGVLLDERNDPENVKKLLVGLKMGEILDQCGEFGVDRATV
eukprot:COSAG06_NODE_55021_length_291_cov_1.619792_1_plen_96_part_11